MAKDKRKKSNASAPKQVSLAQKAGQAAPAKPASHNGKGKKKKGRRRGATIALSVVLILLLAFVVVAGVLVYQSVAGAGEKPPVTLSSYQTTPEKQKEQVAYFAFGLMGEEATGTLDALAYLCYDRQAQSLSILQLPVATYLDNADVWSVKKAGDVYGSPKPLDWCETCRRSVTAEEIEEERHKTCGTRITQRAGSATESFVRLFNEQYGMPVDNFFLLPQEAFVKLVDLVQGIDVDLEAAMKVGDIQYKKGVQTLDGDAALYYATTFNYKDTPASDIDRLVRQRKVFTALFQRLCATEAEELSGEVFGPLMSGSTPIRMNTGTEGLASLLTDPSNRTIDELTSATALTGLFGELSQVTADKATFYLLPGETGKVGSDAVYGTHKADLAALLKESFDPTGAVFSEEKLAVAELKNSKETDLKKQTMAEVQVEQAGLATTTAATS